MKKGYKECPFCKNEIKKEAIKCQYCKEMLPEEEINEIGKTKICPFCKNEIKKEAIKCQYCGEFLDGRSENNRKESVKKTESSPHIKSKKDYDDEIKEITGLKYKSFIPNRLPRGKFFLFSVVCNILAILLMIIFGEFGLSDMIIVFYILNIIAHIYLASKRFHDLGVTGWAGLSCVIPLVIFILYFIPSDKFDNDYGPAPLD